MTGIRPNGFPLYLDYQATTPLAPEALEAMMPYLTTHYGNPHSASHAYGWQGEGALDKARKQIADVLAATPETVTFTSGATEANNLILKGLMLRFGGERPHLVTVETEHKCVLEAARVLEGAGFDVTRLSVKADGLIDLDDLAAAVTEKTALVSVMAVNNEIGVIQPLREICDMAHAKGALVHSDAAQAFTKIPLPTGPNGVDYLSLSAHKIYGPKGIGALWIKDGAPKPIAQQDGGGQEAGIRSGTQAPFLAVGFGRAAEIAYAVMDSEDDRLRDLRDRFLGGLKAHEARYRINGSLASRFPGNLNISFEGIDGARLLTSLTSLAVSSGAACASAEAGPSYVLDGIGVPDELREATLRIGFGRQTSIEDVDYAIAEVSRVYAALQ